MRAHPSMFHIPASIGSGSGSGGGSSSSSNNDSDSDFNSQIQPTMATIFLGQLNKGKIDSVYLDTTYCNPKHIFPSQHAAIEFIANIVDQKMKNEGLPLPPPSATRRRAGGATWSPSSLARIKTLFLIGTYTIGKERIAEEISRRRNCKIFVDFEKFV